jgi:hypothetical protein
MDVLFIGRHNNDIDNMVPVAAKILTGGGGVASYFIATPEINQEKDFRLKYLHDELNCKIITFWSVAPHDIFTKSLKFLFEHTNRRQIQKYVEKISNWHYRNNRWDSQVGNLLEQINPDLIAFDWTDPNHSGPQRRPPYCIGEIVSWAKNRKIPVVALPHGLLLFDLGSEGVSSISEFDKIFVESKRRLKMLVKQGVAESKIVVSGSPRYDPFWMGKLEKILPASQYPRYTGKKFTITFFATKMVYEYDFNKLIAWLKKIASQEGVHLIVQPHPRNQKIKTFKDLFDTPSVDVDATTPASVLIRNSNAVSTLVSSVVVDAMCLNKPVIYPKFLHKITTRFEEEGACLVVNSMEETGKAINELKKGWQPAPQCIESFLSKDVFGDNNRHTIDKIVEEMNKMM